MLYKSAITNGLMRRVKPSLLLQLSPALIVAGLSGLALLTTAKVSPLGYADYNRDGIRDTLLAFPIQGTNSAIPCYIDGAEMKLPLGSPADISIFQVTPISHDRVNIIWSNPYDLRIPARAFIDQDNRSVTYVLKPNLFSVYTERVPLIETSEEHRQHD